MKTEMVRRGRESVSRRNRLDSAINYRSAAPRKADTTGLPASTPDPSAMKIRSYRALDEPAVQECEVALECSRGVS